MISFTYDEIREGIKIQITECEKDDYDFKEDKLDFAKRFLDIYNTCSDKNNGLALHIDGNTNTLFIFPYTIDIIVIQVINRLTKKITTKIIGSSEATKENLLNKIKENL